MQAEHHGASLTSGLKRLRCRSFPSAFEDQLLRLFSARSAFLRAQLECLGDDATSGRLQLPGETGSLWLDCILTTPPDLRKLDDETLAAYLKASEFLQDWYMVKELCSLLGSRLLKAGPEAAAISAVASTKQHISKVLGELSSNLVMQVLNSAPGSIAEQVAQLPQSFTSLAALAHIPALAAACSPATECADQGSSADLTVITVCVHTSQLQPVPATEHDMPACSEHGIAAARIWPRVAGVSRVNLNSGLFTLKRRPGVVACRLLAKTTALKNRTVCLPDCTCLVFESGTPHLENVTFEGGAIVCSGASCQATFDDTVFDRCSLIVLSGAQATLSRPQFKNMFESRSGLSLLVHGVSSKVAVQGGTVSGGTQGVTVQAGAHLEATELTISEIHRVGAEAKDEGSCLRLTGCNFHSFNDAEMNSDLGFEDEDPIQWAVRVHSSSTAHVSSLRVSGMHEVGVCVATHAVATLVDCDISASLYECVCIRDGGTSHLRSCTLYGCVGGTGLAVTGAGSSADASNCRFLQNMCGAHVDAGGALTALACMSSGSKYARFMVEGNRSVMKLTDCASDQDLHGCEV